MRAAYISGNERNVNITGGGIDLAHAAGGDSGNGDIAGVRLCDEDFFAEKAAVNITGGGLNKNLRSIAPD
jgi:hypothetical protein